jgi:hypothetical protein
MSVEFLPGDEPDVDTTRRPAPKRDHRRWWPVAALAVVAALIWAVTRPSTEPVRRTPHRPAAHSSAPTVVAVPECKGLPDCSAKTRIPAPIARLAQAYLPVGARLQVRSVIQVNSFSYRDQLVARDIDAHFDSATVRIRLQRGGPQRQELLPDPPGVGSLLLHGVNSGLVVRLQYLAPETVVPQLSRLRALMRDPRLVAP